MHAHKSRSNTIGKTKRRVEEKRNVGKSEKRNVVKIETKRKQEKPRARQKNGYFDAKKSATDKGDAFF